MKLVTGKYAEKCTGSSPVIFLVLGPSTLVELILSELRIHLTKCELDRRIQ
jgi:hypothetical protein